MQGTRLHRQGSPTFLDGTNERGCLEDFRNRFSFTELIQMHEILIQLRTVTAVKDCTTIRL